MGQLRIEPLTTKNTHQGFNKRMSYVVTDMCGWRPTMEDAHIVNPNFTKTCALFAVFDGHGGAEVSTFASRFFETQLLKNQNFANKKYDLALTETFQSIDKLMQSKEGEKEIAKIKKELAESIKDKQNIPQDQGNLYAGCTAVVCLITQNEIICANAGDSRCLIYRKKVVQNMSEDHKPENETQLSRITRAGGTVVQGRICGCLNLSRGLGDFQFKSNRTMKWDEQMVICKPDIIRKPLQGTQYIVLGCDGIFQQKTNKQIMNMVKLRPAEPMKTTAQGILDSLLAKNNLQQNGLDNMSLIIVKIKQH